MFQYVLLISRPTYHYHCVDRYQVGSSADHTQLRLAIESSSICHLGAYSCHAHSACTSGINSIVYEVDLGLSISTSIQPHCYTRPSRHSPGCGLTSFTAIHCSDSAFMLYSCSARVDSANSANYFFLKFSIVSCS